MTWSLSQVLASVHDYIEQRLATGRKTFGHPESKGDTREAVWLELFAKYLPKRYSALKAFVVDSKNTFSEQIDAVIFDRQYSPFIFNYEGQAIVPAESVYAVFEAKQTINAANVRYAQTKLASVRRLHRTSLPIPTASGVVAAKPLHSIIGGILTLDSEWSPPMGQPLTEALHSNKADGRLDLGCIAAHGIFASNGFSHMAASGGKPATAFLLELIAQLQTIATVPMIDIREYARWLIAGG